MFSREDVIEQLCAIVNMAHNAIGDYTHASDCFCRKNAPIYQIEVCGDEMRRVPIGDDFQHQGVTIEYVRDAVVEKLKADGYDIDRGLNDGHPIDGESRLGMTPDYCRDCGFLSSGGDDELTCEVVSRPIAQVQFCPERGDSQPW